MKKYHAILRDECGDEFSRSFEATDRESAWDYLADFEECSVVSLYDDEEYHAREDRIYKNAVRSYDDPYYDRDQYDY